MKLWNRKNHLIYGRKISEQRLPEKEGRNFVGLVFVFGFLLLSKLATHLKIVHVMGYRVFLNRQKM